MKGIDKINRSTRFKKVFMASKIASKIKKHLYAVEQALHTFHVRLTTP